MPMQIKAAILSGFAIARVQAAHNYRGCITPNATALPYCNTAVPMADRVKDLVGRLTLAEKIGILGPEKGINPCDHHDAPVERLGLPEWLVETNTAAASSPYDEAHTSTTFSGPMGLGASFNRTMWRLKGQVIGRELRAFNNIGWHRGDSAGPKDLIGVTGFGPNINNPRDPRFGRTSELPGEDPYHSGQYAKAMVSGMQTPDAKGFPLMLAYLKHFTAYSRETDRGHDNYAISLYDYWDTYLPQYRTAFLEGNASGVMCSYNGENGRPSCANSYLLNDVMRSWSPDALCMTDCGAVTNLRGPPVNAPSDAAAAAYALMNGTDLEAGSTLFTSSLGEAVSTGLATEAAVTTSVTRVFTQLFSAGLFEPVGQVRDEAAAQSFVLLKNDGALPLKAGSHVAVIGPQASAQYGLLSDYYGDQVCVKGFTCITSIAAAINATNAGGTTVTEKGVDINSVNIVGIPAALEAAKAADGVVLCLGIDKTIEHEGKDRAAITLPGLQDDFAKQVLALKKPTVLVLTNGGVLAIDTLMSGPSAIVEAFNPAFGAPALADTLFGRLNRWGKLP
eukprot:gene9673-1740_t